MKKFFAILAIASVMTACNNSDDKKEAAADSTIAESPLMDAVNTADSAGKVMADSVNNMMMSADSTGK